MCGFVLDRHDLKVILDSPVHDDPVHHPLHYGGDTTYEAIKVIESWQLNFNLGNVLKYIRRLEQKDTDAVEDLEKARWYLDREIARRKGSKAGVQAQDTREDSIQGGS